MVVEEDGLDALCLSEDRIVVARRAIVGADERGGSGTRTTRGVCWPAGEEVRMHVGPVIACAHDEARLGWSPRGGSAAGSDQSGGEDEAAEKKAWRLLDPVGEEDGGDREEEN